MSRGKQLGFWMCLALVMGNMIGSGVFLLPASLAPYGLDSVLGWVLTAAGSLLMAAVFSTLSRHVPQAQGPYAYTRMAFGELPGFVVAWGYWISLVIGNAAIATMAVSYLSNLFPAIASSTALAAAVTLGFVWAFIALNVRGARETGGLQIVTTALKLLPLLAVIALGVWLLMQGDARLQPARILAHEYRLEGVTAAATLTLWAFLGLESASVAGERVIDPERNIPRATLWGTAITAVVYISVCTLILLLVPSDTLAASNAPFAEVIGRFWGESSGHWLAAFAAISGLGALSGWILLQGELPYQMAKAGVFPAAFGRLSAHGTPAFGLVVSGVLLSAVVLTNYGKSMVQIFNFLILISTTATLVMYLGCALGALVLHHRGVLRLGGRLPLLLPIAALAALYVLWALAGAGRDAVQWGFFLLSLAVPLFFLRRGRRLAALASLPLVLAVPALHVLTHFSV